MTVKSRDSKIAFRGSLIDEFLFSIDVKEWGLEDQRTDHRRRRLATSRELR
jgi:hypothetical protein